MYQRDTISLTTAQQNAYSYPIDDLQIVDAEDRMTATNIIRGIYCSHNLIISVANFDKYTGVWDAYGKLAFGQASEDADEVYKAVIMIPVAKWFVYHKIGDTSES